MCIKKNKFFNGQKYNLANFKYDLVAAIVVFLVAIPLCLGIALASGVSLISGLISGIIGGIVVGIFSSSSVSVSGPAAGMVAVIVVAINQLGDFNTFLLALFLGGIFQVLIGSIKAGFVAEYIPSNIVQGLLCAIGVLLIIKQLPLAFTLASDFTELKLKLLEATENVLTPSHNLLAHINIGASIISIISFAVFIYMDKSKKVWLQKLPAPIIVVLIGIVLNEIFISLSSSFAQGDSYLVRMPNNATITDLVKQLNFPNWLAWQNPTVYLYALMIGLVASIETLLNVKAGEKLDKKRRFCSKDRELIAQGFGNMASGLIGGLPITSVIVRTSVNIQSGAKTKLSTILHGLFLFLSLLLFAKWLNKIPLASLAAILIYTGYKLTKPYIYVEIYRQGIDRFLPFIVTVITIVAFNLLEGIIAGLTLSLFFILKTSSQARLDIIKEIYPTGTTNRLILPQQITFLNKASLTAELNTIPANSQLIIDARYAHYIDKEIIELLKEFENERAPLKNITLNLIGFQKHYDIHNYINFINVTTYDVQTTLKPQQVLNILKEGNSRFLTDTPIHRISKIDIKYTATTQHPIAIVLGCIDSRVPVETIFDMSFGDVFVVRVAGNIINDDVLASMEYACKIVGAKLIVVLGHTRCGAIQASCEEKNFGKHINQLLAKIKTPELTEQIIDQRSAGNLLDYITKMNVINSMINVYSRSKNLSTLINKEEIGLVGAVYDVASGKVKFNDYAGIEDYVEKHLPSNLRKLK